MLELLLSIQRKHVADDATGKLGVVSHLRPPRQPGRRFHELSGDRPRGVSFEMRLGVGCSYAAHCGLGH